MDYLIKALAFIFILGAAVVIHEFGHFIIAKFFKIRVEVFSFGFGKRLFGYKKGDTDYRVSLVPLGGYVKLGGDESNAPLEGEGASDIPPEEQFNLRPRYQKIAVALGGPVANILTALAIPFCGALFFGAPLSPTATISAVKPNGAAEVAGLKPGDKIISYNGRENPSWDDIEGDTLLSPEKPIPMVVERNGQKISLTFKTSKEVINGETIGRLDFIPDFGVPIVLKVVESNTPAAEAGLQANDKIVSIDGQKITSSVQMTEYILSHTNTPLRIVYERGGVQKEVTVQTRVLSDGKNRLGLKAGEDFPVEKFKLGASASYAVNYNLRILRLTGQALGQVFSGQRNVRDTVSGPIGIARASAQAADRGIEGVLLMLGFLSLNLGVFNLLPIPVLDGGAIFICLVEGLLEKIGIALSTTIRERIQYAGLFVLLVLMVFVIGNDIVKVFTSWRGNPQQPPAATAPQK
jgi:regulator of sigma E protease